MGFSNRAGDSATHKYIIPYIFSDKHRALAGWGLAEVYKTK